MQIGKELVLGMLIALGMNKIKVFSMIFMETIFLVFAGVPFGLLLSWLSVYYTGKHGIDFSSFSDAITSLGYDAVVYPELKPYHYGAIVVMVAVTAHDAATISSTRSA